MPRKGEALRWKGRLQNFSASRHELKRQHIARQNESSHQIRKLIRGNPAVNGRAGDRDFPKRQKAGQARTAKRASIGRVQPGNLPAFQVLYDLIHGLLHGGKVPRILGLMAVKNRLKHVPRF